MCLESVSFVVFIGGDKVFVLFLFCDDGYVAYCCQFGVYVLYCNGDYVDVYSVFCFLTMGFSTDLYDLLCM